MNPLNVKLPGQTSHIFPERGSDLPAVVYSVASVVDWKNKGNRSERRSGWIDNHDLSLAVVNGFVVLNFLWEIIVQWLGNEAFWNLQEEGPRCLCTWPLLAFSSCKPSAKHGLDEALRMRPIHSRYFERARTRRSKKRWHRASKQNRIHKTDESKLEAVGDAVCGGDQFG